MAPSGQPPGRRRYPGGGGHRPHRSALAGHHQVHLRSPGPGGEDSFLAEAEAQWTRYLEADDGSPEAFFGQVLVMFAAWVADQELESIKRRTREGLERARQQGKALGPPRKFRANQVETMRRMRTGGASLRRIAADFECSASTVLRVLQREQVAP